VNLSESQRPTAARGSPRTQAERPQKRGEKKGHSLREEQDPVTFKEILGPKVSRREAGRSLGGQVTEKKKVHVYPDTIKVTREIGSGQ